MLELFPLQVKKALELQEQLRQRMGVVVVGPSGAGKSTLWRMLRAALGKTGKWYVGAGNNTSNVQLRSRKIKCNDIPLMIQCNY